MLARKFQNRGSSSLWIGVLLALLIAGLAVRPAAAHTRAEFGPYTIVLGWEKEPVIVGERNSLLIHVTEGETPVEGLEGKLGLTVFYGGESFIGQLAPAVQPGVYKAEIFPTLRGQYEVQIIGEIEGVEVDAILEPEEVLPAGVLQFPEVLPEPADMQAQIDELTKAVQSARSYAFAGLAAGVIGIALAAIAWLGRGKNNRS